MDEGWRKSSYSSAHNGCVEWRTSTYSAGNGACVQWRKSSHSGSNGHCVEVADGVQVRDSKDPDGPVLSFTPAAWQAFINTLKTTT